MEAAGKQCTWIRDPQAEPVIPLLACCAAVARVAAIAYRLQSEDGDKGEGVSSVAQGLGGRLFLQNRKEVDGSIMRTVQWAKINASYKSLEGRMEGRVVSPAGELSLVPARPLKQLKIALRGVGFSVATSGFEMPPVPFLPAGIAHSECDFSI